MFMRQDTLSLSIEFIDVNDWNMQLAAINKYFIKPTSIKRNMYNIGLLLVGFFFFFVLFFFYEFDTRMCVSVFVVYWCVCVCLARVSCSWL